MRFFALVPLVVLLSGCIPLEQIDPSLKKEETLLVPANPFGTPQPVSQSRSKRTDPPADKKIAFRVDHVGKQILKANPQIGLRPFFATLGSDRPELFHTGDYMIHITSGLVNRCKTDGQLAALLSHEMAEMVAEREVLAHPKMRRKQEQPPIHVPIGNAGHDTDPSLTRVAELARYEEKRQQRNKPIPIPNPEKLAKNYLKKAGYSPLELDGVQGLLAEAERTYMLEKQFKKYSGARNWTPAQ